MRSGGSGRRGRRSRGARRRCRPRALRDGSGGSRRLACVAWWGPLPELVCAPAHTGAETREPLHHSGLLAPTRSARVCNLKQVANKREFSWRRRVRAVYWTRRIDAGSTVTSDSFTWTVELVLSPAASGPARTWSSADDFAGPTSLRPLPEQVAWAWQTAYCRLPNSEELAAACAFVVERMDDLPASGEPAARQQAALTALCQQLLSSNEFLYVE